MLARFATILASRRVVVATCAILLPLLTLYLTIGWREPTQDEMSWTDAAWYFTPTFAVLHRALREGFLPLWNPYQFAGWPFLAAFQTQVLYPPAWAVAWLEPVWATTAYASMHWAFGFIGAAAFARCLGLNTAASLATALVYCLSSGVSVTFFAHTAGLAVVCWLPWCALALAGAVRTDRFLRELPVLVAALTLAVLAGAPEHLTYLLMCLSAVAVWLGWEHGGAAGSVRACLRLAVAGVAVALLSAGQILPTLELMQHAIRSVGSFELDYVGRFSIEGQALFRALVLGGDGPARLSVLVVPLAALAFISGETRRRAVVPAVLCLLLLDFLRGTNGCVFPIYFEYVPLVSSFRTHLRMNFVFAFFASVLAGLGVQAFTHALRTRPALANASAIALLAVLAFDLMRLSVYDHVYVPLSKPSLLRGTPELAEAVALMRGPERVFVDFGAPSAGLQHKFGQMQGVHHVAEYDALVPMKYARFFSVPEATPWMGRIQFRDRDKQTGSKTATLPGVELPALDLASTRYYLSLGGGRGDALRARTGGKTLHSDGYALVERAQARPRAYVVHRAVTVSNDNAALAAIREPSFDAAATAVLTKASLQLEEAPASANEDVVFVRDEPNVVTMRATCASRCLLVLTDLFYPGWDAWVDGARVEIFNANYLFRGVALETGTHEVDFRYRPLSVPLGLAVSIASGLVLLIVRRRSR